MIGLVCLLCGVAGAGLVLWLCDWLVALFRMSTFEGGAGYLMVFVFTPLAFFGGLIIGALTAWRFGPSGYLKTQALALLMTVAVFWAVVGVSYLCNPPQALPLPPPPLSEAEKSEARVKAQAERAKAVQEEEERFQALTPDSSLRDYLDAGRRLSSFDDGEDKYKARQEQVLAGAARVKSRQGDAIDLLNQGAIGRLEDLWRYSLSATPELCAAYNRAFVKYALRDRPFYVNIIQSLERQVPNLKWLAGARCDVDESLAVFAETLQLGMKATDPLMQERLHIASLLGTVAELHAKP